MKFAKYIFWIAGIYGMVAVTPLYFMLDWLDRKSPPPVTHPDFYYGFVGLGLAWQIAFLVIATDPARFRPMMLPSVLEKFSYVAALAVLYAQGRVKTAQAAAGSTDLLLGLLFLVAFFKTRAAASTTGGSGGKSSRL
jgi:hypothetical protein